MQSALHSAIPMHSAMREGNWAKAASKAIILWSTKVVQATNNAQFRIKAHVPSSLYFTPNAHTRNPQAIHTFTSPDVA
jgi:hypothetical protein